MARERPWVGERAARLLVGLMPDEFAEMQDTYEVVIRIWLDRSGEFHYNIEDLMCCTVKHEVTREDMGAMMN